MRRTMTRQLKKVLYTFLCGILLLGNKTAAFAATEAVYEHDVERGEDKVYRGVVNTDGLNVRKAAGKNNPLVQVNGKGVTLNKHDEVAVLDKALSSKETWYKISFRRGDSLIIGYVHGSYVDLKTDVIIPLPSSLQNPLSADSVTDSQAKESGISIGFWIVGVGVIVVAILILCIKDRISDHSYSSSYSGSSYSDSYSGSSYSDSYSSSSLWDSPSNHNDTDYDADWARLNDDLDYLAYMSKHMREEYGEDWMKDM